ncbi:MAG: folate-binding protein [Xanthomonadales bacterium]|nr:folate-binding protein [Xanthomonadales bacterium]
MSPASIVRLAGCQAVAVDGPDATAFLQSQTMNDVLALAPGQWHWNGILNAKGRVLFLFRLLRREEHRYLLIQSVPRAAALAAHLSTFRFRARARIAARPELTAWGRLNPVPLLPAGTASVAADDAVELSLAPQRAAHLVARGPRRRPRRRPRRTAGGRRSCSPARCGSTRRWPAPTRPRCSGWTLFRAFSLRKGCYPGQEIVARTHYLGVLRSEGS